MKALDQPDTFAVTVVRRNLVRWRYRDHTGAMYEGVTSSPAAAALAAAAYGYREGHSLTLRA